MTDKEKLRAATEKADAECKKALPHLEAALTILADALGFDPEKRPEVDYATPDEHWIAARLMQNVWTAHLHCDDRYGS